jgi:hypothetical protein
MWADILTTRTISLSNLRKEIAAALLRQGQINICNKLSGERNVEFSRGGILHESNTRLGAGVGLLEF